MIPIDKLLDIVLTEAIEKNRETLADAARTADNKDNKNNKKPYLTPSIQFDLELIQNPDGSLYWAE